MDAFQRHDGPQLIICSLKAASQGITLTRASNVAFLELDWTPARHAQAEDRLHRIGQESAVNTWYLLAADTIDETMSEVLERKKALIGSITDGQVRDSEPMVAEVIRELKGRPFRHLRVVPERARAGSGSRGELASPPDPSRVVVNARSDGARGVDRAREGRPSASSNLRRHRLSGGSGLRVAVFSRRISKLRRVS